MEGGVGVETESWITNTHTISSPEHLTLSSTAQPTTKPSSSTLWCHVFFDGQENAVFAQWKVGCPKQ